MCTLLLYTVGKLLEGVGSKRPFRSLKGPTVSHRTSRPPPPNTGPQYYEMLYSNFRICTRFSISDTQGRTGYWYSVMKLLYSEQNSNLDFPFLVFSNENGMQYSEFRICTRFSIMVLSYDFLTFRF